MAQPVQGCFNIITQRYCNYVLLAYPGFPNDVGIRRKSTLSDKLY